jgi:alkanesulfonate monooxygenase SsuD/methylene tetrahydromethanopterin reductase-like flavin-dependent oxidoreductase (luciferase family)
VLTYDFRLPPGPRTVEYALLAEDLGFRAVWCPIAEKTKRIKFGPSVLIPSYRHPMAQASAIATLEQIAPGRLMVGFGTGFTGRAGMGKKPLSLASMRTHIAQVKALLRGDIAAIDGGLAQILASDGWFRRVRRQTDDLHGHPRGVARTSGAARCPRRYRHHLRDQRLRCGTGAAGLCRGCRIEVTEQRPRYRAPHTLQGRVMPDRTAG